MGGNDAVPGRPARRARAPLVLTLCLFSSLLAVVLPAGTPARGVEPGCTISAKLVNSCRPWLGAESGGYGVSGFRARMLEHEARIGRQVDIVHAYTGPGAVLSTDMVTLARRPATIALINWKPSYSWAAAGGLNTTVNAQIDRMAGSIKALGESRIMLTVYHEPEAGVTAGGAPSCPTMFLNGSAGTTTDYVNMWRNVRHRFDALGVENVVWVMNYTGYVTGQCLTRDLWPGNAYVDWLMWDPYPKNASWTATVGSFYNYLTANSDAEHDYLSKAWGLGEFGYVGSSQPAAYAMYAEARRNLQNGVHPRIKAFVVWDNYTSNSHDDRVGFTENHVADPLEQESYNAFANDTLLMGTAVPEPIDQTPPTVALSAPEQGAAAEGTVTVTGSATDDEAVDSVDLLVDGEVTDTTTPAAEGAVTFAWNSLVVGNGEHSLQLRARDAAGNAALSVSVSVTVSNVDAEPPTPPAALDATWSRPSRVTLSWTGSSDNAAVTGYRVYRDGELLTSLGSSARGHLDLDVANLTSHSYAVSATDPSGNESDQSEPVVVDTGDDSVPTTPTAEAVLSNTDEATVTWGESTDNAGVTGYRVQRNGVEVADVTGGDRVLVDGGLDDAVTFTYRVQAYDAAGNLSPLSAPVAVTTPDTTSPTTPPDLRAVSATASVALTWQGATDNVGVTDYVVFRDGLPLVTLASTARSYTDSALVGSVLHSYQVLARDAEANESPLSNEVVRTVDSTAPTAPTTLSAVSATSSVALTWGASSDLVGVTNYLVYRDGLPLATLGSTARSYTDNALVTNTLHRYQVTARDAAGNESGKSNEVARTLADTTVPVAPVLSGSLSGFTARLTWTGATDNVGVTGYTVYRGGVAIATTTAPAYTDPTPPLARASSYTVRARDAAGNVSAASNTVSVSVPADRTAPSAPSGLRVTVGAVGTRRIVVSWNASTDNVGVTNYYLFRGNAKYRLLGKVTTFTDTGLTAGVRYTYKVYALDASGNWSGSSGNVSGTAR